MKPMNLAPAVNNPATSLYKPPVGIRNVKSQGPSPETQLSFVPKATHPGDVQMKTANVDTPVIMGETVYIDSFELSPELKEIAASAGVPEDHLSRLIAGLGDKERENFLSALATSGDSARKLINTTDRLQVEEREVFLTFADSLSNEGLQDFLTAVNNSPKDLESIMETASNLSDKDLDNYLSAAANAGEDIDILNRVVNDRLETSGKQADKKLSGFLSAAAKSGRYVMDVIEKTEAVSKKSADKLLAFIDGQSPREDLDNFLMMMGDASEGAINTIIDISPELSGQDQRSLLKTASRLGDNLDRFAAKISTLAPTQPGSDTTDLSNFITTAGKAGKQMEKLLALSDQIDLGMTSQLSTVDTANFLVAADKAGDQLPLLTELTGGLSGNDRSNLLYGVAYTDIDPEEFLSQVKNMGDDVKSDFLLSAANEGQEEVDPGIFMKGILSPKAYENFKATAASMGDGRLEELVAITNELDETDRNNFLKMGSTAGDTTEELIHVVTAVSGTERKEFLDVGSDLVEDNLKNFIKTAETAATGSAPGVFSDFVDLARDLEGYELSYYLKAGAQAKPDVLDDLTDFVKELTTQTLVAEDNEDLKLLNPVAYYETIEQTKSTRFNFLKAASEAGQNLEGLINMGRDLILEGGNKPDLTKVLTASAVSEKYLGSMIRTYA